MATEVIMPRQGNTVESCIILSWKKKENDPVAAGEVLCEVETDKATFEVEAPESGTLLKVLHPEGADVPVLETIAVIGTEGEEIGDLLAKATGGAGGRPAAGSESGENAPEPGTAAVAAGTASHAEPSPQSSAPTKLSDGKLAISPRARNLADAKGLDTATVTGSGPGGRIIERDIQRVLGSAPEMTPAAIAALKAGGGTRPAAGSGLGGRVTGADVAAAGSVTGAAAVRAGATADFPGPSKEIKVQGVRKRIAERMLQSLQSTAQLTLNMPVDARSVQSMRARLKATDPERGLVGVSLNDMINYAVARTLRGFPELNAHFLGDRILQFERVHLGFAVDTPRGLMVPVIRNADLLSLKEISQEARRLAAACLEGKISPDELSGASFTVTNLGALGIESFTPVLNPPQVGIVGVGTILPRPVEREGSYEFVPHITLSLTVDHQGVDGAPASRYLRALASNIAAFDLLLAE